MLCAEEMRSAIQMNYLKEPLDFLSFRRFFVVSLVEKLHFPLFCSQKLFVN